MPPYTPCRIDLPAPREPPTHCATCNLDFQTYDAFHRHKVRSPRHVTCHFCSKDFTTKGARTRHQLQNHAAEQNLNCPSCHQRFTRLGGLVTHLEIDKCGLGEDFVAMYQDRKDLNNSSNTPQGAKRLEFGQTSGDFADQYEHRSNESGPFASSISERSSEYVDENSENSSSGQKTGSLKSLTPKADIPRPSKAVASVIKSPVFKSSAPILNPIYPPPAFDLLSDDPLPVDAAMVPKADEDLISFDRIYDHIVASEILNAPLSLKNEDAQGMAVFKAKAFMAKQEEQLKAQTTTISKIEDTKIVKPNVCDSKSTDLAKDAEYVKLGSPEVKNGSPEESIVMDKPTMTVTAAGNAWLEKKDLFPDAPTAIAPPTEVLKTMTTSKPQEGDEYAPHDPNDPAFDVRKYYVHVLGKYKCPFILTCTKKFDSPSAFRQHLNSPAHREARNRFQCRNCLRYFQTAGALAQHSEAQAVKCVVRDTDQYDMCVDEFSASHATVAGKHSDDTVRYAVVKKPVNAKSLEATHNAIGQAIEKDRQTYWKRNTPIW